MYIPTTEEIITRGPRFNSFFRAPNNVSKLVSQIANVARQNEGLDSSYTFKTVQAIAMSPWNHHILYDLRGYENYGFEGPQYTKDYSLEPLAAPGTGNNYPVIWIPDPDSPLEPGQVFEPQAIQQPTGFDEITWTPPEIQQMAHDPEPLPEEIVSELADPTRQTIVLEPLTQEAQEIALANPNIPTEIDAELVNIAYALSENAAAILESPHSTPDQKAAAVMEISDLALAADLADPATIEDVRNQALMTIGQQALEEEIVYAQVIETPIDEPSYMDQPYQEKGTGIGPWAFVTGTIAAIKIFGS
jgi:hypothetical protein